MLRKQSSPLTVKDEGTVKTTDARSINFVGADITATGADELTVTVSSAALAVKDEGVTKTAAASSIDFVGPNVVATNVGSAVTVTISGGGVDTLAAVGAVPNDNAASLSGTTLTLQPADATHPGVVSEGTQTLGSGRKTVDSLTVTGEAKAQSVLLDVSAPSAPAAGVVLSARASAGPSIIATPALGAPYRVQPSILRPARLLRPIGYGNTSINAIGFPVPTALGDAVSGANFATTNIRTQTARATYASAATSGATGGWRNATNVHWRGNAAGLGGFRVAWRFGFSAIPATRRWFVGLYFHPTTPPGNVDPSTAVDIIAVGQDTADTEIQFMHNDGSGACTKSSSAISSPTTAELLEVILYAAPNASDVIMSVEKLNSGVAPVSYTASSNLPSSTTSLYIYGWVNNESTAAVMSIDFAALLSETDY
jgi:hypothetical protein